MTQPEFDEITDRLEHHVAMFVDDHPALRKLSATARRNIAYCAASGGMSALTEDELKQAMTR